MYSRRTVLACSSGSANLASHRRLTVLRLAQSCASEPIRRAQALGIRLHQHAMSARYQRRAFTTTTTTAAGRKPLPPMPRILSLPAQPQQTVRSWRTSWDNGSILIGLGWSGLALLALDRYLLYQIHNDSDTMIETIRDESVRQKQALVAAWRDQPALFECIIRHEYKNMGGSHGLVGVVVGDVVQVLQQGVGPNQQYNLCRIHQRSSGDGEEQPESIGWYPMAFMEQIPVAAPKRSLWQRIFAGRSSSQP
jgi:hypothetical protein